MINPGFSGVQTGYFSQPNSWSASNNHQGFTQRNQNFGNFSLPQNSLQLILQLLQQIQSFQQQPSHNHHSGGHYNHHQHGQNDRVRGNSINTAQAFNTPVGATQPGPATNGQAYEFTVQARPGERLSFASMLAATNDQFIAPKNDRGIALFDQNGNPRSGDITRYLAVWDAGTEANEPIGNGPNQPANQAGPNTGPDDPNNRVRRTREAGRIDQLVNATLTHNGDNTFTVRIENISGQNGNEIPITPGVVATHGPRAEPLFSKGQADRGNGLEALAEDGDPTQLLAYLQGQIGK